MIVAPRGTSPRLAIRAAGFIATSTSGASPGVSTSWSAKCSWKLETPGRVPWGARISAGKFGSVDRSLPIAAVSLVKRSPVSCIPSPESPANRITTRSSVWTVLLLTVHPGFVVGERSMCCAWVSAAGAASSIVRLRRCQFTAVHEVPEGLSRGRRGRTGCNDPARAPWPPGRRRARTPRVSGEGTGRRRGDVATLASMEGYAAAAAVVLAGILLVTAAMIARRLVAPRAVTEKGLRTYESGVDPVGVGWAQSQIRYISFAFLYVVFAVDAVYLFPWALVIHDPDLGVASLVEVVVFVGVILVGLVHAGRRGLLRCTV